MANTTNFGWETPDDTDLVKDGAAAIRTLAGAIDTSLVDLKGGTTGQILSKATNTDMDFTWITNDVGDITAVTAGTGISGGGTTGAVTITNDMATTITASGDIVVGTGSGTYDNLPIGTTGQVLTADTTVSPYKVKWATASSGGMTLINTGGTTLNTTSTVISSIPSGYNSLRIITVVTDPQDDGGGLRLRINQDSTANRHAQGFFGGSISNIQFNQTSIPITASQDNGTPNGISITDIVFYDNTSIWKFATNFAVVNSYLDNARAEFIQTFGAYNQTGAVTSLEFFFNAMNASGGTVYVYGVK